MSLFVGFISCCNCRKLREEVCLCWFSVRTGSQPWSAKRLCNFFHLIWRSLEQHRMLCFEVTLFRSARRATPHCSVSLLIFCFFTEQSSRSWGRWEWEKGETLGTLSNHRMTVNHHCRTLKGKDNSAAFPAVVGKCWYCEWYSALAGSRLDARERSGHQSSRVFYGRRWKSLSLLRR